ncbi:hypothetical protein COCNU_scaffold018904G000020 [Cocos nucifera]|nr:hypothetical protein [Cocos nucifera]
MRLGNKACIAVALGAALELKDEVAVPNFLASKRNYWLSTAQVGLLPNIDSSPNKERVPNKMKAMTAEESLRMVFYLSCWGPN